MDTRPSTTVCPSCKAPVGSHCVYPSGQSTGGYHADRRKAAKEPLRAHAARNQEATRSRPKKKATPRRKCGHEWAELIQAVDLNDEEVDKILMGILHAAGDEGLAKEEALSQLEVIVEWARVHKLNQGLWSGLMSGQIVAAVQEGEICWYPGRKMTNDRA